MFLDGWNVRILCVISLCLYQICVFHLSFFVSTISGAQPLSIIVNFVRLPHNLIFFNSCVNFVVLILFSKSSYFHSHLRKLSACLLMFICMKNVFISSKIIYIRPIKCKRFGCKDKFAELP